jgi:uncharacterized protein (TIGR00369 family)
MTELEPRTPQQSRVVLAKLMEVEDSNLQNNVHGGVIMRLVDTAAGMSAAKHSGGRVVTAAMDEMSFLEPVLLGEIVTVSAQVNDVGRTSMEVGARVSAEDVRSGEVRHVSTAYLVFVAMDDNGEPRAVPPLEPENSEERRRMSEAKIRRKHRLARKEEILARRKEKEGE